MRSNVIILILIYVLMVTQILAAQENLSIDYQKTKQHFSESDIKQRQILSSLYDSSRKMKKIINDRARRQDEKISLQGSAKSLSISISQLEQTIKMQKTKLKERLVALYKLGDQGLARLLFNVSSAADLERNLKILGLIAGKDYQRIQEYLKTISDWENKKIKLTNRLVRIGKLEDEIVAEEKKLQKESQSKAELLNQIRGEQSVTMQKLSELRSKSESYGIKEDAGILDPLFRPSFFEKKGMLPTPVAGKVLKDFGVIRLEDNSSWSYKGVFFSVPRKSPVLSVFEGTVAFVGGVPGFGQTVIVDHGDHYYTVYGNNNAILVREGEEVKQNQVISQSGVAQEDKAGGLYFEVRHFSEPSDPKLWLKGITL